MFKAKRAGEMARNALFSCLIIGFLLALSACGQQTSAANQQPSYTKTVNIEASWAIAYNDVKSAKAASDAVLLGTIESVKSVTGGGSAAGVVATDFVFKIEQTIVDAHHLLHGSTIIIHQTGGITNDTKYEVSDDPLFQVNEHALLFLRIYQPGYAFVVGGPSGRFIVENNLVKPRFNAEGMTSMRTQSVPVKDFIAQIQSA
jgi:hypothetical protein